MKFDPATNTVTTEADEALFDLTNVDMDMAIAPQTSVNNVDLFGNRQEVIEKEQNDTDSVSTFNSKRAPPAEIATLANKKAKKPKDDSSSTSTTSSLSITTKNTLGTLGSRISTLQTAMDRIDSKFDFLIQNLNLSQKSTNNNNTSEATIVTPAKNNHPDNTSASQSGTDAEASLEASAVS